MTLARAGGVVRILPCDLRRAGAPRSVWVHMPAAAGPQRVVYVIHGLDDESTGWASIDAATALIARGSNELTDPILVIPIAAAEGAPVRRARKSRTGDRAPRTVDLLADVMSSVERSLGLTVEPQHRIVAALSNGLDDLLRAAQTCNQSLPPERRFRLVGAPAGAADLSQSLLGVLRASSRQTRDLDLT